MTMETNGITEAEEEGPRGSRMTGATLGVTQVVDGITAMKEEGTVQAGNMYNVHFSTYRSSYILVVELPIVEPR